MHIKHSIFILFFIFFTTISEAQLRVPALSTSAEFKQTIGLTEIEVKYSRPSAKGRKIFGKDGLIPYKEFWRTGANSATKITFGDDIIIGKQLLKKGAYTILTIPEENMWSIHFYPYESTNWNNYVKKEPLIVLKTSSIKSQKIKETFTISVDNIAMDSADLIFAWEYIILSVPIKVEVKDRVMDNIKKAIEGPSNNEYFQAALFMHETQIDLETALTYIQKVTKSDKALFFQVYREALILKDLGRKKEAITVAKRSLELSKAAKNNDFIRLNENLINTLR